MRHHEAASIYFQVAAMRGGEDIDSRTRRTSSRCSLAGSLTIAPTALRGESHASVAGPSAERAGTADLKAAAVVAVGAADVASSDRAEYDGAEPRPQHPPAETAAGFKQLVAAETPHGSNTERGVSSSEPGSHGCLNVQADVAWQPGIESLMEELEPSSPTEARRLSDSAASGPHSYPLSPGGLSAVSPEPLPRERRDSPSGGCQAGEDAAAAVTGSIGLPASNQPAAPLQGPDEPVHLNGWSSPTRTVRAAFAAGDLAGQRGTGDYVGGVFSGLRPLEKQSSNVAPVHAMPAAAKQSERSSRFERDKLCGACSLRVQ